MVIRPVPETELWNRMRVDNPWWSSPHKIDPERFGNLPKRAYFDFFFPFVEEREPNRALILMGPRRVGKTVMLHQAIQNLIDKGTDPRRIFYLDIQTPLYNHIPLDELIRLARGASLCPDSRETFVFFDEIQYLPSWEVHLKNLVDVSSGSKFVASGSAAAALRLKSIESGAGRFTDFVLPPITFYEYCQFIGKELVQITTEPDPKYVARWLKNDLDELNEDFFNYLNHGGYPEAIFSPKIQSDMGRYIKSDIVDKVLMKDLPSLYGIQDIQELNSLFTMLAYNTSSEVSLDSLSQSAGVAKNTIKRYIEYLETAFLVKVVHRVDRSAKRFSRANFFKVYLTNPSLRTALFSPTGPKDNAAGPLVETAVFSQWFHSTDTSIYYARWEKGAGEVDMVWLDKGSQKPSQSVEVKWSDSCVRDASELSSLRKFLDMHKKCRAIVTTKRASGDILVGSHRVSLWPSSVYCYVVGWNVIRQKREFPELASLLNHPGQDP